MVAPVALLPRVRRGAPAAGVQAGGTARKAAVNGWLVKARWRLT